VTYNDGQRWVATISSVVTELVIEHRHNEETLRRFFEKVDYGFEATDCHIWTGALSDEGYGVFSIGPALTRKVVRAHRVRYIWAYGEPPEETPFLDHATTCIGRFCLNLTHLEPVDNAENQRRRTNVGKSEQRTLRSMELALRDERRAQGEDGVF